VIVWTDGEEIVITHNWHCECGFCKMENSRMFAVKLKVGWITRWKSNKSNEFPKIYCNNKGNWKPFPKKRDKRLSKNSILYSYKAPFIVNPCAKIDDA
jgi:hypothetical protein